MVDKESHGAATNSAIMTNEGVLLESELNVMITEGIMVHAV